MKGRFGKFISSALRGRLLLRLGAEKYLPQIIFFFFMSAVFIGVNLGMEGTLHRMEENKKVLENLKSMHTELTCRLTSLNNVCRIEDMLKEKGSEVRMPVRQAEKIR